MRCKTLLPLFLFLMTVLSVQGKQKEFILQSGQTVTIACCNSEKLVVRTSLEMLGRDIRTVLSATTELNDKVGAIVVGTVGQSNLINETGIDLSALKNKKQAFLLTVSQDGKLVVAGSDSHGTAYGILEISRLLGVSPWEWWADVTPEKRETFRLSSKFRELQSPSVEYRGIFINDEDWGLMPWGNQTYEPSDVKGEIGPRTNERIFELLLRLRANTYWPAMHECTLPFFLTKGNREMAKKYGVPLVIRSSLNNSEGTVVKEVVSVERMLISGVALDTDAVRIAVIGLKDSPGVAFKLFDTLAKKNINVDMILQSIGRAGTKDISFTVDKNDLDDAMGVLEANQARIAYSELHAEKNIAKLSIVGAGMMSNPGVAAKMFESLYNEGVNINMIATSEIRVTVLINEKDGVRAMNAVHDAFNLAD